MKTNDKNQKLTFAFIIISALAGFIMVIATVSKYGPGLTHDSAAYMYSAESLAGGMGYEYFGYISPFIQWPPLFPTLLAVARIAGVDALGAAGFLNALSFGLIIFFSGKWMFRRFENKALAFAGTLLVVFSMPILQVAKYMWTETVFILFFLLTYIMIENFKECGKRRMLVYAAIFTALACLSRYAGAVIVPSVAIFLLFGSRKLSRRIVDIVLYGVISLAPLCGWIIRNFIVSGTLMGVRIPSTFPLSLNITRTIESVLTWFMPNRILVNHIPSFLVALAGFFEVLLPVAVILAFIGISANMLIKRKSGWQMPFSIGFHIVFCVIYLAYIIASATTILLEPINSRYLVPVYLPAVFIILVISDILTTRLKEWFKPNSVRMASAVLAGLFLLYPMLNTGATARESMVSGAGGYSTATWQGNKLIDYVRQNPNGFTYYSNCADAVYATTGVRTYFPPKKSGPYMYGLEQFRKSVDNSKNPYVIWFKSGVPATMYGIGDIEGVYGLEIVKEYNEGTVYRIVDLKK